MIVIFTVALCSACTGSDERENNLSDYKTGNYEKNRLYGNSGNDSDALPDYKPMIYVNHSLYGETGEVFESISEKATFIGTVQKLVSQNEAMVDEEFSSNAMPLGSELYLDETDAGIIYVKILKEGRETYAEYATIQ